MNREARRIFAAALAAADPGPAVERSLALRGERLLAGGREYRLDGFDRLLVVGGGKAAVSMGAAVEGILGDRISGGLLVARRGSSGVLSRIALARGSHPLPDEEGLRAALEILEIARSADERTLVLCLLSGGASALLAAPAPGLTLDDKQAVTGLLLRSGASIDELNAVRKHLSLLKGGRLARAAHPAAMLTLVLSDVIGDRLDVIASGPTAPDASTFADAAAVIAKYGLWPQLPARAAAHLRRGLQGLEEETVRKEDPCFAGATHVLVGSLSLALDAAAAQAADLGFRVEIVTRELQGEARDAARWLAARALRSRAGLRAGDRLCLLSGGETTVTVRGAGRGGRNQELALAFAMEIASAQGITLLSVGSDGVDGPTDAAGAWVDGGTVRSAREAGLVAADYLANNDSFSFFHELDMRTGLGSHVMTGPTGTNVMDIQVILLSGDVPAGRGAET